MEGLLGEGVAFLERVGVPRDHVTALVGPFREGLIEKKRVRLQKIGGMGWVEAEAELLVQVFAVMLKEEQAHPA